MRAQRVSDRLQPVATCCLPFGGDLLLWPRGPRGILKPTLVGVSGAIMITWQGSSVVMARNHHSGRAAFFAAVTLLFVSVSVAGAFPQCASADEPDNSTEAPAKKPLKIDMGLETMSGEENGKGNLFVPFGVLIRVRLGWTLLPTAEALESAIQFRTAAQPAPSARVWADVDRSVEVFAETTGVGGSQATLFDLSDLPSSLWLEPSSAGTVKLEMRVVKR